MGQLFSEENPQRFQHMAIGSIIGIVIFVVRPLLIYAADIFQWSQQHFNIAIGILFSVAIALSIFVIVKRIGEWQAKLLFILFIALVIVSSFFDKELKQFIAINGGYFDQNNPITPTQSDKHTAKAFYSEIGAFQVDIPTDWQHHQLEGLTQSYFVLMSNNRKIAEFRPLCSHGSTVALPEAVQTIMEHAANMGYSTEKNCFFWGQNFTACLIRETHPNQQQRWRWLADSMTSKHGIWLDFVINDDRDKVIEDVLSIITSLAPGKLPEPLPHCIAVTEWF